MANTLGPETARPPNLFATRKNRGRRKISGPKTSATAGGKHTDARRHGRYRPSVVTLTCARVCDGAGLVGENVIGGARNRRHDVRRRRRRVGGGRIRHGGGVGVGADRHAR